MKKLIFCIITLSMLMCNCGSGMIGLLEETEKNTHHNYMNKAFVFQNGCEYFVYVEYYHEPLFDCENTDLEDVVYSKLVVVKKCAEWEEGVELADPYTTQVAESLHEHYIDYVCN